MNSIRLRSGCMLLPPGPRNRSRLRISTGLRQKTAVPEGTFLSFFDFGLATLRSTAVMQMTSVNITIVLICLVQVIHQLLNRDFTIRLPMHTQLFPTRMSGTPGVNNYE